MYTEPFPLTYQVKLIGPSNNFETEAPADTCACVSIITLKLIKFLGYEESQLERTLDGSIAQQYYKFIKKVKVAIEGKTVLLDMMVSEAPSFGINQAQNYQVLLGMDFLRAVNFLPRYIKDFSHLYKLIKESKQKFVLIIGEDKTHLNLLYQMRDYVKDLGYEGLLLKDYPDIEEQSCEEKMNLFGHLARFVICENSAASGHIDELNICARNRLVTIILQDKNVRGGATWMQASYPIDFKFVKRISYTPATLNSTLSKAVAVAELLVEKRKILLNKEYKYRKHTDE